MSRINATSTTDAEAAAAGAQFGASLADRVAPDIGRDAFPHHAAVDAKRAEILTDGQARIAAEIGTISFPSEAARAAWLAAASSEFGGRIKTASRLVVITPEV